MSITEIEQAIAELSPEELARFRKWFEEFDARVWEEQIENDAKTGKLDKIADKAIKEYRAGKAKEL